MGSDVGILWIILASIFMGIFYLFLVAGDKLTPKKSLITGNQRTEEEIKTKGFNKAVVLFVVALLLFAILTGLLNN